MITKVGESWLKAVREFDIEELIPEEQQDEFSAYLSDVFSGSQNKLVARFLIEDWQSNDTLCLLGYVWAVWHLDEEEIAFTDIEILMPEMSNLEVPELVGEASYFIVDGVVSM